MTDDERGITKKNTAAFQQGLEHLNVKVHEQQVRIDTLQAAMGAISEKINAMEKMLMVNKAMSIGNGPSVR